MAGLPMETTINAMIVLDADGNRICSKYYTPAFMGNSPKQVRSPPPRSAAARAPTVDALGLSSSHRRSRLFARLSPGPPCPSSAPLVRRSNSS